MEPDTLAVLEWQLRGPFGDEYVAIGGEYDAHSAFWKALADRHPETPKLLGLHGDTLLLAGKMQEAMELFLEAFSRDSQLVYAFGGDLHDRARELGGSIWLGYRLACLRAGLQGRFMERQEVLDVLQELLAEHGDDEAATMEIRRLLAEAEAWRG